METQKTTMSHVAKKLELLLQFSLWNIMPVIESEKVKYPMLMWNLDRYIIYDGNRIVFFVETKDFKFTME